MVTQAANQADQTIITHKRPPKNSVKYINSWENIYFVYFKRAVIMIVPLQVGLARLLGLALIKVKIINYYYFVY